MPTLAKQIRDRAHKYVAHGGKKNRRQQVERLVIFVGWVQAEFRLTGIDQIGKRQAIAFWKAHREMAPSTANGYWLALRILWGWLGRAELPPEPRVTRTGSGQALDIAEHQDCS